MIVRCPDCQAMHGCEQRALHNHECPKCRTFWRCDAEKCSGGICVPCEPCIELGLVR